VTSIRLAVPNRGRLRDVIVQRLCATGYLESDPGRSLYVSGPVQVLFARSSDIPALLRDGLADFGVTGDDYVADSGIPVTKISGLGIDNGDLCYLTNAGQHSTIPRTLASQYPNVAGSWIQEKGWQVEVRPIAGAAELYVRLGVVDGIVDIVASGETARQNNLEVAEFLWPVVTALFCYGRHSASEVSTLTKFIDYCQRHPCRL